MGMVSKFHLLHTGFPEGGNNVKKRMAAIILLVILTLGGCSGPINPAFHVFSNGQRWTAEEMDIFFDVHSKYCDYKNAHASTVGRIRVEREEILICVDYDTAAQLYFYTLEEGTLIAESRFIKAPDDYTYVIRIGSSKIPDILPNGTILTFKREDITEDELFMPEELGGLKQEVITRSTADEMDIFFDTHPKYRNYENSSTDMVGCIHTESENVYFCAEYSHKHEYALHFYFLDKTNTEFAIGRRITADLRSYQVEIECSQIPDILPDGTILTFIREDIPIAEMFMPEELGELKQEDVNEAQE